MHPKALMLLGCLSVISVFIVIPSKRVSRP